MTSTNIDDKVYENKKNPKHFKRVYDRKKFCNIKATLDLSKDLNKSVAVTDLFPLTNQCPRQAIQPHTDQSVAECIDSFFLSRTIFSGPFWKSRQVREHLVSSQDRPLSRPLQ